VVAAILLRLAGVPVEVVADDYALSEVRLEPRHSRWLADAHDEAERARIERISATPREAMRAVLDALDQRYGGVETYLLDGGLARGELEAARSRLR
jgi:protein tyrosine/serine phosphatase